MILPNTLCTKRWNHVSFFYKANWVIGVKDASDNGSLLVLQVDLNMGVTCFDNSPYQRSAENKRRNIGSDAILSASFNLFFLFFIIFRTWGKIHHIKLPF